MTVTDLDRFQADRVVAEIYPEVGFNIRLSDVNAALGIAQLKKLDTFLARLRTLGKRYDSALKEFSCVDVRAVPSFAVPTYQSYILSLRGASWSQRDRVLDVMLERGVATKRGLMAAHLEPCYRDTDLGRLSGSLRHTEEAVAQTMLLPIFPTLSDEEQTFIVGQLREALAEVLPRLGL